MDLDYSNQDLDILPEIDGNPKYFTCSLNYLRYLLILLEILQIY